MYILNVLTWIVNTIMSKVHKAITKYRKYLPFKINNTRSLYYHRYQLSVIPFISFVSVPTYRIESKEQGQNTMQSIYHDYDFINKLAISRDPVCVEIIYRYTTWRSGQVLCIFSALEVVYVFLQDQLHAKFGLNRLSV